MINFIRNLWAPVISSADVTFFFSLPSLRINPRNVLTFFSYLQFGGFLTAKNKNRDAFFFAGWFSLSYFPRRMDAACDNGGNAWSLSSLVYLSTPVVFYGTNIEFLIQLRWI